MVKGTKTMTEYLRRIKEVVNHLASIGEPVSFRDHVEVIFDGLPEEFSALSTLVTTRAAKYTVAEVEAMVTTHETRLERTRKRQLSDSTASALLTHAPVMQQAVAPAVNLAHSSSPVASGSMVYQSPSLYSSSQDSSSFAQQAQQPYQNYQYTGGDS